MRRIIPLLTALVIPAAAVAQTPGPCAERVMRQTRVVVCTMDAGRQSARLLWKDKSGTPYGSLSGIDRTATPETGPLLFAMNAGMYHDNLDPVGLYVEKGETLKQAK